jgi:hypothetical protein
MKVLTKNSFYISDYLVEPVIEIQQFSLIFFKFWQLKTIQINPVYFYFLMFNVTFYWHLTHSHMLCMGLMFKRPDFAKQIY